MALRHHYHSRSQRSHSGFAWVKVGLGLSVAVGLFVAGLVWFRHQSPAIEVVSTVDTSATSAVFAIPLEAPGYRPRETATLFNVDDRGLAEATRQVDGKVFHHTVVAHLSPPGEGMVYEGWLLREQPFDFFSTGTMTPNADGTYALIWDGPVGQDFIDYTQVIITLEPIDLDPAPGIHVLEGEFAH